MLTIALLTVEDEFPEAIWRPIRRELAGWLLARKGLVRLHEPADEAECWATNLADWRRAVSRLAATHDLVFCTVDLRIPDEAGAVPDVSNGLAVVHEVRARSPEGIRCCVLTGVAGAELRQLAAGSFPDVLFDFKGDPEQGHRNVVTYIKSQALALVRTAEFPGADGRRHRVLLDDDSGRLREQYLAKAPYCADPGSWHVPTLLVGAPGLGHRVDPDLGAEVELEALASGQINCAVLSSYVQMGPEVVFSGSDSLMPRTVVPLLDEVTVRAGDRLRFRASARARSDLGETAFAAEVVRA